MNRQHSTIRDVARATGVSVSTVSRALGVPGLVRDETRQRVLAGAEMLGYRTNWAARSLVTGRTGTLGIVVPDLGNPYFHAIVQGAQAEARREDHIVVVGDSQERPDEERALIGAMGRQVDGIVLCSSRLPARVLTEVAGTRVVLVGRRARGLPAIVPDSRSGMRQVVEHLARLGHRRVAYVPGPVRSWSDGQRRRALDDSGPKLGVLVQVLDPVAPDATGGVAAVPAVLDAGVSAVIAYNDLVAVGVVHELARRNVAVPDQISVVGFDDIPVAAMAFPPLTTVAVPTREAGRLAVGLLLDRLRSPVEPPPPGPVLPTTLVVRESTAPEGDHHADPRTAR